MKKALFIVRDLAGKPLLAIEKPIQGNMFTDAHRVMDVVQAHRPWDTAKCCELWTVADPHTMNLLRQNKAMLQLRILPLLLFRLYKPYVDILHGAFSLEISEVSNTGIVSIFRLFRECFRIAGCTGLIACCKYSSTIFLVKIYVILFLSSCLAAPKSKNKEKYAMAKRTSQWTVNIPLSDLTKLMEQNAVIDHLQNDNKQLRRELNGLRNLYSALLVRIEEIIEDMNY